jgi:hypothetical protein
MLTIQNIQNELHGIQLYYGYLIGRITPVNNHTNNSTTYSGYINPRNQLVNADSIFLQIDRVPQFGLYEISMLGIHGVVVRHQYNKDMFKSKQHFVSVLNKMVIQLVQQIELVKAQKLSAYAPKQSLNPF